MSKYFKLNLVITSIVILMPMFVGISLWSILSSTIAIHFGPNGLPDMYTNKAFFVFGMPLLTLLVQLACAFCFKREPEQKQLPALIANGLLWIIPVISTVVFCILLAVNRGYELNVTYAVQILLAFMLVVLGAVIPTVPPNKFVGVRLPWTLASKDNWYRTHQFTAVIWVIAGVLIFIFALTQTVSIYGILGIFVCALVLPALYSFLIYKKG